jgi:hypothetical protein
VSIFPGFGQGADFMVQCVFPVKGRQCMKVGKYGIFGTFCKSHIRPYLLSKSVAELHSYIWPSFQIQNYRYNSHPAAIKIQSAWRNYIGRKHSATLIQSHWRRVMIRNRLSNPYDPIGRKRLAQMFSV